MPHTIPEFHFSTNKKNIKEKKNYLKSTIFTVVNIKAGYPNRNEIYCSKNISTINQRRNYLD